MVSFRVGLNGPWIVTDFREKLQQRILEKAFLWVPKECSGCDEEGGLSAEIENNLKGDAAAASVKALGDGELCHLFVLLELLHF